MWWSSDSCINDFTNRIGWGDFHICTVIFWEHDSWMYLSSNDCNRTAPTREFLEETSQLLAARWSRGTNVAYQSAWKWWISWYDEREVHPFSCTVKYFLEFLTSLYKEGLQYRTTNTIRSAVSSTHAHIKGAPIGKHLLVSRLFIYLFIYLFIKTLQHKCWRSVGHQVLQPAKDGKRDLQSTPTLAKIHGHMRRWYGCGNTSNLWVRMIH